MRSPLRELPAHASVPAPAPGVDSRAPILKRGPASIEKERSATLLQVRPAAFVSQTTRTLQRRAHEIIPGGAQSPDQVLDEASPLVLALERVVVGASPGVERRRDLLALARSR